MKKSLFFFVGAVLCWVLAGLLIVRFGTTIAEKSNDNLVKTQGPTTVTVTTTGSGKLTLWHNYQDVYEGTTVNVNSALPQGYQFTLRDVVTGQEISLVFISTPPEVIMGNRAMKVVGTFQVPVAGDYELSISGPASEPRLFTLEEGTFGEDFKELFGLGGTAVLFGLLGFVLLIVGVVFLFVQSQQRDPSSS